MKDISSITLSAMDRVDSLTKIKGIILQEVEFHEGNFSNYLGFIGNVFYATMLNTAIYICLRQLMVQMRN